MHRRVGDQIEPFATKLEALDGLKIEFSTFSQLLMIRSFSNLQVKMTRIKSFDEIEFRPDPTSYNEVSCLLIV